MLEGNVMFFVRRKINKYLHYSSYNLLLGIRLSGFIVRTRTSIKSRRSTTVASRETLELIEMNSRDFVVWFSSKWAVFEIRLFRYIMGYRWGRTNVVKLCVRRYARTRFGQKFAQFYIRNSRGHGTVNSLCIQ